MCSPIKIRILNAALVLKSLPTTGLDESRNPLICPVGRFSSLQLSVLI